VISSVLNLALCLLFIHIWQDPIVGVAWATAIATWVGAVYMLNAIRCKFFDKSWKLVDVPAKKQIDDIAEFAGPAFLALSGKVVCYATMSYAAAGAGTVALAAHQVRRRTTERAE
jgi:Na+-driven multidrug efflux pump